MAQHKKEITRADILDMETFEKERAERRKRLVAVKKNRRIEVGPYATFYFENYDTMWHQIHEMLYIERGGEDQIKDELAAYNPLIPQGRDLSATVMFEIDDPDRRKRVLGKLGGVETQMYIRIGARKIMAEAEGDIDRTTAEGKASSVHFVHFPFGDEDVAAFADPGTEAFVGIGHREYNHLTPVPEAMRAELLKDFD